MWFPFPMVVGVIIEDTSFITPPDWRDVLEDGEEDKGGI